jgi:tetratricopeptide (TPR) repeat protein
VGIAVWQSNCFLHSAGSESPDGGDKCESLSICFLLNLSFSHLCQEKGDVHTTPNQAFLAETQGRYAGAIVATSPVIEPNALSRVDRRRAWTLLGVAYEELGRLEEAQTVYERSIDLFMDDVGDVHDYGSATYSLTRLYQFAGQLEIAIRLFKKDFDLYKQPGDHRGFLAVYTRLTEQLELLERASAENCSGWQKHRKIMRGQYIWNRSFRSSCVFGLRDHDLNFSRWWLRPLPRTTQHASIPREHCAWNEIHKLGFRMAFLAVPD